MNCRGNWKGVAWRLGIFAVANTAASLTAYYCMEYCVRKLLSSTIDLSNFIAGIDFGDPNDSSHANGTSVVPENLSFVRFGPDQVNYLADLAGKLCIPLAIILVTQALLLIDRLIETYHKRPDLHARAASISMTNGNGLLDPLNTLNTVTTPSADDRALRL